MVIDDGWRKFYEAARRRYNRNLFRLCSIFKAGLSDDEKEELLK